MARRKAAPKRKILPDPLFGSELLAKFINILMKNGKKSIAEKIIYGALEEMVAKHRSKNQGNVVKEDESGEGGEGVAGGGIRTSEGLRKLALESLEKVLDAVRPTVEVKSRRIGGATYQVPVEVRPVRGTTLAMRWLIQAANARREKTMVLRLAGEMLDALADRGGAIKKRETVHSMAKANQAFAHFRW